jgi:aspartate racemase
MPKHIGIVGCSAEGAALCYRTICVEGAELLGGHAHPELTMHTFHLDDYMRCIDADDWAGVADLMVRSAEKVAGAGADFAISPDNTIHQAFDLVVERSPIPWLHIAEEVTRQAQRDDRQHLLVLGTRYLMEGPVYRSQLERLGIRHSIPEPDTRARINRIIFEELTYGRVTDRSQAFFVEAVEAGAREGCDAVVLGCTEIPLIVTADVSPLPPLDSTRLLARAALAHAVA